MGRKNSHGPFSSPARFLLAIDLPIDVPYPMAAGARRLSSSSPPHALWGAALSYCLSGKSTRGMPGGIFVGEEGIPEPRVGWLRDDARVR